MGTKIITSTKRDATYTLDEILNNITELEILEHTTDTSGYTDIIFALFLTSTYRLEANQYF